MSQITFRIHSQTAESMLSGREDGALAIASLSRQAIRTVQCSGRRITYAPVFLPNGAGCAMSVHTGADGLIVEIDRPGTLIAGRGVVIEGEINRYPSGLAARRWQFPSKPRRKF